MSELIKEFYKVIQFSQLDIKSLEHALIPLYNKTTVFNHDLTPLSIAPNFRGLQEEL